MTERILESTTAERQNVTVKAPSDPTGGAVEFAVTTGPSPTDPSGWVAGSWFGTWSAETSLVTALTPVMGNGQALSINGDTLYDLWVRFTVGTETPVKHVGRVRVV